MILKYVLCLSIIFGGYMNKEEVSIKNYISEATKIEITYQNHVSCYAKGDQKYEDIIKEYKTMLSGCREMPALGVSLDEDIKEAKKSGMWIELIFNTTVYYNEMPFDALLIEVVSNYTGFNIHRKVNGKYQGRCYYINLASDMSNLHALVTQISK